MSAATGGELRADRGRVMLSGLSSPNRLVFLLGGARSGKSRLAQQLAARWEGPVSVIATAEPGDAEMAARIAHHKRGRPATWTTVEEPRHIADALGGVERTACVIIDCVTLWVSNLLAAGLTDADIGALAEEAGGLAALRPAPTVVVSNEVGAGVVPRTAIGRRYRDLLGTVNAVWAGAAGRTYLLVAGKTLLLDQAEPGWEE
ncbi:MAG: bifunctional adenosylcobinamide kinase/adenosylcobinamide-phosphate guanylyltransferase [Acidimicrobiia bacterium]